MSQTPSFLRGLINIKQMYSKIFVFSKINNLIFDFFLLIMPSNLTLDQLGISCEPGFALLAEICSYDGRALFSKLPPFVKRFSLSTVFKHLQARLSVYHIYLYYLQRLDLTTGFMQILGPYDIRQGTDNKVNDISPIPFLKETDLNE